LDILAKIPGNESQNLKFFLNSPSNKSLDGPKTDPALPGIMFTFLLSYYPMPGLNKVYNRYMMETLLIDLFVFCSLIESKVVV